MDHKPSKCFWTRLRCDDLRLYHSGPRHMSICFFFFLFDIQRISAVQFSFFKHLAFLVKRALVFVKQPRGCSATHVAMARRTAKVMQKGGGICGTRSCLCLLEETLTDSLYQSQHLRVTFALSCTIQVFKIRENDKKSFTYKRHFVLQIRNNVCLDSSSLRVINFNSHSNLCAGYLIV